MREVLPELLEWWRAGETIGMGTVVATFRSAPRPAGASMLVVPGGTAVGSVSGGCVEGAVYELASEVIESGVSTLQRYGISDDDAFAVGLTCGGILDVYVEKVNRETFPELEDIAADLEAGRPVAVATVIEHPDPDWVGRRVVLHPVELGREVPRQRRLLRLELGERPVDPRLQVVRARELRLDRLDRVRGHHRVGRHRPDRRARRPHHVIAPRESRRPRSARASVG